MRIARASKKPRRRFGVFKRTRYLRNRTSIVINYPTIRFVTRHAVAKVYRVRRFHVVVHLFYLQRLDPLISEPALTLADCVSDHVLNRSNEPRFRRVRFGALRRAIVIEEF